MYQAFGLLKPDSDFNLEAAAAKLAARLPNFKITRAGNGIVASTKDWEMHLGLNSEPSVAEESVELAPRIARSEEEARDIASCNRRVEVSSDDPDPQMEHFNDYLIVVEVMQSFKGVISIDPEGPSLL